MEHAAAGFDALGRHEEAQRARALHAIAIFFCGSMEDALRLSKEVRSGPMDLETETLTELFDFWYEGHHGPIDGPSQRLARVVDLLRQGGSADLWFICMTRVNALISRPGVSAQIQRLIESARAAADDKDWSLQANANLMEGWVLLWQGKFAELQGTFQGIEDDAKWLGQPGGLRTRLLALKAYYQVICDDEQAVRATRDAIVAEASLLDGSSDLPLVFRTVIVRISAAIGDWQAVRMHLPAFQVDVDHESPTMQMFVQTLKAQLALQEGRVGEALTMLRELSTRSTTLNTTSLDATVRTQLALAELADGSPAAAWHALQPLIARIAASGNPGEILTTGLQSLTDLSQASWGSVRSSEALATLRGWVETAQRFKIRSKEGTRTVATQQGADLSARELEVLALLAEGQSNKLIARALDLSPHTVKRHVARILDRLDLASRMQAANWYRAHVVR
jgi:LuxR family maltose regulon positive regulatory protein